MICITALSIATIIYLPKIIPDKPHEPGPLGWPGACVAIAGALILAVVVVVLAFSLPKNDNQNDNRDDDGGPSDSHPPPDPEQRVVLPKSDRFGSLSDN